MSTLKGDFEGIIKFPDGTVQSTAGGGGTSLPAGLNFNSGLLGTNQSQTEIIEDTQAFNATATVVNTVGNLGALETQFGFKDSAIIMADSDPYLLSSTTQNVMACGDGWNSNKNFLLFHAGGTAEKVAMPEDIVAFPNGISGGMACALDASNGFYCGGNNPNNTSPANPHAYSFNWSTKTWTRLADMPGKRDGALAVNDGNGKIYIIGGRTGVNTNMNTTVYTAYDGVDCFDVWIYNIAGNSWTVGPTMSATYAPDCSSQAILLNNGKILIVDYTNADVKLYDTAGGTFSVLNSTNLGFKVSNGAKNVAAAKLQDGRVVIATQADQNGNIAAGIFNPTDNSFSSLGHTPTSHALATSGFYIWAVQIETNAVYVHANTYGNSTDVTAGYTIDLTKQLWSHAVSSTNSTKGGNALNGFWLGGTLYGCNLATDSELNLSQFSFSAVNNPVNRILFERDTTYVLGPGNEGGVDVIIGNTNKAGRTAGTTLKVMTADQELVTVDDAGLLTARGLQTGTTGLKFSDGTTQTTAAGAVAAVGASTTAVTNTSIPDATETTITFGGSPTGTFDTDAAHGFGSGVYVVPQTGKYLFSAIVALNLASAATTVNSAGYVYLKLYLNTTVYYLAIVNRIGGGQYLALSGTIALSCAANDQIKITLTQHVADAAAAYPILGTATSFSAALIGT